MIRTTTWVALVTVGLVAGGAVATRTQSTDDVRNVPTTAVRVEGTYGGRIQGRLPPTETQPGVTVSETVRCRADITLRADGTRTANVSEYFWETVVDQVRSGVPTRTITRRVSDQRRVAPQDGSLTVWVTSLPNRLIRRDVWSNQFVTVNAQVFHQVLQQRNGRWEGPPATEAPGFQTFFCHPRVYWTGADGRGIGLPMRGHYQGPDANDRRQWISVTVDWDLREIR